MNPSDFIHPEDAAALRQLQNVPGLTALTKKFLAVGYEQIMHGVNMASCVKLSPSQLPELYNRLPPICDKLGIEVPDFYLTMNPMPNAWTFGDTRIYIQITSGLVEMLTSEELDSVIAHECGHILCRHVLYSNLASFVLGGINSIDPTGLIAAPLKLALFYWNRKSELSADRAAAIITSPEVVARSQARLAGGPRTLTDQLDLNLWAQQAEQYEVIRNDGFWNKSLQMYAIATSDHPFAAVRVREILKWGESEDFRRIKTQIENGTYSDNICPGCHQHIESHWQFCQNCGANLKK